MDIEFSLALHNRTGKYFIGRDIIEDQASLIGAIYYWRRSALKTPTGLSAKLLGRMLVVEHWLRRSAVLGGPLLLRSRLPMLHLDPATVCHAALSPADMVLCHDLGPLTHPELFTTGVSDLYVRAYERIRLAKPRMIFVSRASQSAFEKLCGALPSMQVIYPPIRAEMTARAMSPVAGVVKPFLLTVGSLGRRKNQAAAIRAFARSGLAAQGYDYVLCGAHEPGSGDIKALASATPGVKLLSYVSDGELAWLYSHAAGFVLPSLLEGFGVPVAEAIAHGLLPVVTAGSVLEEVAGEGALTVDPSDDASIARAMQELVTMTVEERSVRGAKLAASVARFTRERFREEWGAAISESPGQEQRR